MFNNYKQNMTKWIYCSLCILGAGLFLYSIPKHKINTDEPWLGEQAYYRATDGTARSPMFRGIADGEKRVVVQHKLLVEIGALSVWLFGWGLIPLRIVPISFALVFAVIYGLYMNRRGPPGYGWLAAGLLLLAPLYFQWGKIYRPEIMVAAFAFCSFVLLEFSCRKDSLTQVMLSGFLAGGAMYSHYNGVTVVAAGFVTYLFLRRFRMSLLFILGAVIALSPYLYEIFNNWDLFYRQIFENPMVASKVSGKWYTWLLSLVTEHKRLFRSPEILVMTVPFVLAMITVSKKQLTEKRIWYLFWFTLMFFTALVVKSKLARYALVLHPFFISEIVRASGQVSSNLANIKRRISYKIFIGTVSICVLISLAIDIRDTNQRSDDPELVSNRWAQKIPIKSKVIAPMIFVFNEISNYDIIALDNIRFLMSGNFTDTVNARRFFELCEGFEAEFVIVPTGIRSFSYLANSNGENMYQIVFFDKKSRIYQRKYHIN